MPNAFGLPEKRSKHKFVKPQSQKVEPEERLPSRPFFCPCKDPETGEKCGKMMDMWDDISYNKHGMCEKCVKKYNPHLDVPDKV